MDQICLAIRFAKIITLWQSYVRYDTKGCDLVNLRKQFLQIFEQENSNQLDEDTTFSAKVAGWTTVCIGTSITLLSVFSSSHPLALTLGHNLILAALMLLGSMLLLLLGVSCVRYRSARTFWEYLLSLKRIPPTHWTTPQMLDIASQVDTALRCRQVVLFAIRYCPHYRSKHKAPLLLFQQAALLLAP